MREPISLDRLYGELRAAIVAVVEEQMAGSKEAAVHTHIECFCPGHIHRKDDYDPGCFCPDCAADAAEALGYPRTDIEPDWKDPDDAQEDDGPRWCETCGRLISIVISDDGAEDELLHWETSTAPGGPPKDADDWRVFLLAVKAIKREHLPGVALVIERAQPIPPNPKALR